MKKQGFKFIARFVLVITLVLSASWTLVGPTCALADGIARKGNERIRVEAYSNKTDTFAWDDAIDFVTDTCEDVIDSLYATDATSGAVAKTANKSTTSLAASLLPATDSYTVIVGAAMVASMAMFGIGASRMRDM